MNPGHDAYGVRIYKNYITNHSQGGGNNESVFSILTDVWGDSHLTIDGNLLDDVLNGIDNQQELHTIKVGSCFWRYNTVINSPRATITMRETCDSEIIGNWMAGGADLLVRGDNHLIKWNHGVGTGNKIRLECGNAYNRNNDGTPNLGNAVCQNGAWNEVNKWGKTVAILDTSLNPDKCRTAQAAPSNCRIAENTARIEYGKNWGTQLNSLNALPLKNITLVKNKYAWTAHANATAATLDNCTQTGVDASLPLGPGVHAIPAPNKNNNDEVGPWAP
jgi:hypothetical protein